MSHITLTTQANFLLALFTSQSTLNLATLHQEANIYLPKVIIMGSQHLTTRYYHLVAHITLGSHHTSMLELQCKDQVTKVVYSV